MNIKKQTNTEFVHDLMEFGNPLKQIFIIEAILRYAREVSAQTERPDNWPANYMIDWQGWHMAAVEIKEALERKYDGPL